MAKLSWNAIIVYNKKLNSNIINFTDFGRWELMFSPYFNDFGPWELEFPPILMILVRGNPGSHQF